MIDYEASKKEELATYTDNLEIHSLPSIFHYWSNRFLLPNLIASGFSGVDDFYAKNLFNSFDANPTFLSIGSGSCDTEIRIVKLLREMGLTSFRFECVELNLNLLDHAKELADKEKVSDWMIFTAGDLNDWKPDKSYSGVMAHHSLHHVLNLENLFDSILKSLTTTANFVTNDIIGRNGHLCWPESKKIVDRLWLDLPNSYRYNHQLKRHEPIFEDWDCSKFGFEGVRAQDILPLLVERFSFRFFFGFACAVVPFIERSFGPNFDSEADWDRSFINYVHATDEVNFQRGILKPTQMYAVMSKSEIADPIFVRGISPAFAVRSSLLF